MSPGFRVGARAHHRIARGAFSSDRSRRCCSSAAWARAAGSEASPSAMSSWRGPSRARRRLCFRSSRWALRHTQPRSRVVHVVLADAAARCVRRHALQPLPPLPRGEIGIGLRRGHLRLRLLHFFRRAPLRSRSSACSRTPTSARACASSRDSVRMSSRATTCSSMHAIAFFDPHFGDAVAAIESQRNLPDIDIALHSVSRFGSFWGRFKAQSAAAMAATATTARMMSFFFFFMVGPKWW